MKRWNWLLSAILASVMGQAAADDDSDVVTYSRDIAPIFFNNCVNCHRPNDIGPMSLMDFESTRPYAKSIKKTVLAGTMPPFHADTKRVKYKNDSSLTEAQIALIGKWVDQGAPEGSKADLPKAPVFDDTWVMGQPDLIFHAKKDFVVPPNEDEIPYQAITFDTSALTEDLYIAGWEIRPTQLGVVHHANLAISPKPLEGLPSGSIIPQAVLSGGDYVGSYLPGCRPMFYPEGTAFKMPKGAHLGIQVHYVGKDKEVTDHLMFGVKLAKGRIDKLVRIVGLFGVDGGIDIPPGEPNYELAGQAKLLYDTLVLSSGAHMHLRGKDYIMENILSDGSKQLITSVPKYDFNWQTNYWLAEPVVAPKGSAIRTIAHYDNSKNNPNNPDPAARVKNGPWTTDEMLNSWSHCVLKDERLGLKLENGRVVGKFDDAQAKPHPRFIQSVELSKMDVNKDADFFNEPHPVIAGETVKQ